ncbi:hypothetical protein HELRODRAFT_188711 [Helobdella robusta]|uniref:Uncharacterized protein n=1 Tax=Helobdella robusta TaxID=6412 RepID=T1FQA4_HELRO|nr:hypothetical protein HELRODRAFT_188711 [Helobdella robusta]ESO02454.1 hypothetical protein HELRODRAFT_188711 [Helobdella robusta]
MSQELNTNNSNTANKNVTFSNSPNDLQQQQQHSPAISNKRYNSSNNNSAIPKRGSRKKTLSLNPEEREALENLVEEVIIDGGMGDSESGSSDDDDGLQNNVSPSKKSQDDSQSDSASGELKPVNYKMPKKYYPGQLKVALKHMTDLPPRFSRKLKKAEKYLELNASHRKVLAASSSIKEEDEEDNSNISISTISTSTPNSFSHTTSSGHDESSPSSNCDVANSSFNAISFNNNNNNNSSNKLKPVRDRPQKDDLKKTIRSLLTDLDQYVDESDRASISLDLPGAVSCSDLEKDSLQQMSTTQVSPASLGNTDQNNNKKSYSIKGRLEHSPGYPSDRKSKKNVIHDNLPSSKERHSHAAHNCAAGLSPNYYPHMSNISSPISSSKYNQIGTVSSNLSYQSGSLSIASTSDNLSSSFNKSDSKPVGFKVQEYSSANSSFIDTNSSPFVMPVTQLVPSLIPPNLTFPQTPQGPYGYSTPPSHYSTPAQVSFDSNSMKYEPQFSGYIDYSMGGIICPPQMNSVMPNEVVCPNYSVGFQMTPVVFRQMGSPPQGMQNTYSYTSTPGRFVNQFSFPPPALTCAQTVSNNMTLSQQSMHQSTALPNILNLDMSVATSNFKNKPIDKCSLLPPSGLNKLNSPKIQPVTNFQKGMNAGCLNDSGGSLSNRSREMDEVVNLENVANKQMILSISTPSLLMDSDSNKFISCHENVTAATTAATTAAATSAALADDATKNKKDESLMKGKEEVSYLKTTFAEDMGAIKSIINSTPMSDPHKKKNSLLLMTPTPVHPPPNIQPKSVDAPKVPGNVHFDMADVGKATSSALKQFHHGKCHMSAQSEASSEAAAATAAPRHGKCHQMKHAPKQLIFSSMSTSNKTLNHSPYESSVNQIKPPPLSYSLQSMSMPAAASTPQKCLQSLGNSYHTTLTEQPTANKLDTLVNGQHNNTLVSNTTTLNDVSETARKETLLSFSDIPQVREKRSDIQLLNCPPHNPCLGYKLDAEEDCSGMIVKLDEAFIEGLINLFIKDKNDGRDEEIKTSSMISFALCFV